jgi:hypothetical protein
MRWNTAPASFIADIAGWLNFASENERRKAFYGNKTLTVTGLFYNFARQTKTEAL